MTELRAVKMRNFPLQLHPNTNPKEIKIYADENDQNPWQKLSN